MLRRKKIEIIASHEFRTVAHTKTFLIITILGPLFIFAVTVLPSLLAQGDDQLMEGSIIAVTVQRQRWSARSDRHSLLRVWKL